MHRESAKAGAQAPAGEDVGAQARADEYDDAAIRFLETLWGDGFLSPGGPEEVEEIVRGIAFEGREVLDIGCGSGGITVLLAKTKPLSRITGFDVEATVIENAVRRASRDELSDKAEFVLGAPGPLPFADEAFDVVFSKDALIHVPDKDALFADIFRMLRPGGVFAASDWLIGHDGPPSQQMRDYIAAEGLSFAMASPTRYRVAMESAGFVDIATRSRNEWYAKRAREELALMAGPLNAELCRVVGKAYVDKNIKTWTMMLKVLESGEHCPTHLYARKPPG